jgi:nitrile hydratase subunit beta
MNGVHDLGGMHGFGAIVREANEPLFHADWEGRVCAFEEILCEDAGYFTIDAFRYGIERMTPADYLRSSYYERWLTSIESNLIEQGIISDVELNARIDLLSRYPQTSPPATGISATTPATSMQPSAMPPAPLFNVGDAVLTRNVHPTGHTRLPRYARGKWGVIERCHGAQTFPDTNAHGLGEQPQPLYTVRFTAGALWGDTAETNQTVSLELWQSYLEPAADWA